MRLADVISYQVPKVPTLNLLFVNLAAKQAFIHSLVARVITKVG